VATPTSHRPNRRAYQKANPSKGPEPLKTGRIPDAPTKTVSWPDPGLRGDSAKRLRGVTRVKTAMMERT